VILHTLATISATFIASADLPVLNCRRA